MFISPAYAQAAGGSGGDLMTFLPLILIFVVFYFLLIRPQQKKAKAHRELLSELRRGDRVAMSGGLIGTITRLIGDGELMIEIADGVKVRVLRGMVSDVLARGRSRGKRDKDTEAEAEDEYEDDYEDDEEDDEEEDAQDQDRKAGSK